MLIVEDDAVISAWLQAFFESMDWDLTVADEGRIALQILCQEPAFDLVLLDIWLPNMNGLEVLRALRAFGISSPVVVMTAYDASFDLQHALELGAADILLKPFHEAHLVERIEGLVGRET